MPDIKISGLPAAASVAGTDEIELNQAGTSRKATLSQITSSMSGGISWVLKASNCTANSGDWIFCDSSAGAFSITLPAAPSVNNYVSIAAGAFASTNPITINRNGNTVMGLAENMTISTPNISFQLVYDGSTWRLA